MDRDQGSDLPEKASKYQHEYVTHRSVLLTGPSEFDVHEKSRTGMSNRGCRLWGNYMYVLVL